ncbi:hypothetical protein HYY75_00375 [bacterium]|nr:hypothetical protein [bacterium]
MKSKKIWVFVGFFCFIFFLSERVDSGEIFQEARPAKKFQDPESPLLSGSVFKLLWGEIETKEGVFNWEPFDKHPLVVATKKRGKKPRRRKKGHHTLMVKCKNC